MSGVIGGLADYFHVFEGATALAESGILLPFPAAVHALMTDVGLLSVLQGSKFDPNKAYLGYSRSREVDWKDKASAGCFYMTVQVAICSTYLLMRSLRVKGLSAMFK